MIFRQFHQREAHEFFVQTLFWQLFSSYMYVVKAAKTMLYEKFVRLTLMKLTPQRKTLQNMRALESALVQVRGAYPSAS